MAILNILSQLDLTSADLQLIVAAGEDQDGVAICQRAGLTDDVADTFRGLAHDVIQGVLKAVESGDVQIKDYDASVASMEREIEQLDASEYEHVQLQLKRLDDVADLPIFDADGGFVSRLRFYSVTLRADGHTPVHLIRQLSPKSELERSRWFGLFFSDGTYNRVTEKTFLFDENIDCVACGNEILILKKHPFHQVFKFYDLIRERGTASLAAVANLNLIANFEEFSESCEGHLQKLAKLNSIVRKGYLPSVTLEKVEHVIDKLGLDVQVTNIDGQERLQFDASDRWALLKLLDDDYYQSEMTGRKYEANSKRDL